MRWKWTRSLVIGLAISILLTLGAWIYFNTLFVFLFLPFIPILVRRSGKSNVVTCPKCGFHTRKDFQYCPHDGTELERQ
ncbi:MAG: hypothetical protein ABEI52_08625 [Halobacteriaceae archaeon]